jgi:hypothetical protein
MRGGFDEGMDDEESQSEEEDEEAMPGQLCQD